MSTVITKKVVINGDGKDVVLDGLDFKADGHVEIRKAASVTVRNCRVFGLNTPNVRNFWLKIYDDIPVRVRMEHCYFGKNPDKLYNLLEMHARLMDGSEISDNYFTADCCAHNAINLYGAEEDAAIHIDRNLFEQSSGTIRIGVKKSPVCRIELCGNTVEANKPDSSEMWQGLCCVQPFGTETETFANMTIVLKGNTLPREQIIYGYSGTKDMKLEEANSPTVTVDGAPMTLTIRH